MKKILILFTLWSGTTALFACTNYIVGKKASADGSCFVTYSADDYGGYGFMAHYPAARHTKGTMRTIIDWEDGHYRGQIPEAEVTYNVIGNMNEHQLVVTETTFGGREELWDNTATGLLDYGSLEWLALQRAKTAREAIEVITSLVKKYGYGSEGESFSIADKDEAWILEMIGKGPGVKGAVWVAVRIPDDCISGHANQSRIHQFPLNDLENCLYAPDVISFARKKGYFTGRDEDFSFSKAYSPASFGVLRYCEARVWTWFRRFAPMDQYLEYASGTNLNAEPMPLYIKPNRKVSIQDVREAMRDHYEGTPFDITKDMGAGWNESPYRPTPLSFKAAVPREDGLGTDTLKCFNERPTSTQQSSFTILCQIRPEMPRQMGIIWFGNDDANMIAYVPVYCSTTYAPRPFAEGTGDDLRFSWQSAFWVCNWVANMVYPRYSYMFPDLKKVRDGLEAEFDKRIQKDTEAFGALEGENLVRALSAASAARAGEMMTAWQALGERMIVKFNDMTVRKEDAEGHFLRTESGRAERPIRVGMSETFKTQYIQQTGKRYVIPQQ